MRCSILIILLFVISAFRTGNHQNAYSFKQSGEEFSQMSDDEFLKWKQTATSMETGLMILRHSGQLVIE